MKILLTGGSGFIGKNIIELLGCKYQISAPKHTELDLADQEKVDTYFKANKFDFVIHCAVKPGHRNAKDTAGQLYNNTKMFFNIERNKNKYGKLIYIGSGLGYDCRFYQPKMSEEYLGVHIPSDDGGFSKYIISKYIEKSENILDLRVFGVFGKYEDYAIRFISNAVCKTLFDIPITIKQNRKFDYICVDDLIKIIDMQMRESAWKYKSFNITPDTSIELLTLAEKIKKISKKDIQIIVKEQGLGPEYSGDNARIKSVFKEFHFCGIDNAVIALYDWYSNNKKIINIDLLLKDI